MGLGHSPRIVSDGLVFFLDAANPRCYAGTGLTASSLTGSLQSSLVNGVGFSSVNNGFFSLDGTNDYLKINNNAILQPTYLTLEIWFKLNVSLSSQPTAFPLLLDKFTLASQSGYRILFDRGIDELQFTMFNTAQDNAAAITGAAAKISTNWNCVHGTYDGSQAKIYLNGILQQTLTRSFTISYNNEDIYLGTFYEPTYGFLHYINANISKLHIYNRALSASEVLQNYNATKGRYGL